jgi:MFS family permease
VGAGEGVDDDRHPYAVLAGLGPWRRWALASRLALLTISMAPLGLVLAGRAATGSFAAGGLLVGAHALGQAVGAPLQGRRADRRERRRAMTVALALVTAVLALLALAVDRHAPLAVLVVGAGLGGIAVAGIPGGFRAMLPAVVPSGDMEIAFAVDAVLLEVVWITGPALVALVAWATSATAVVVTMAAMGLAAMVITTTLPRSENVADPRSPAASGPAGDTGPVHRPPSLVLDRQALPVYAIYLGMGCAFAGVDLGFAPLAKDLGATAAAGGLLVALLSLSSGLSGLAYGARIRPGPTTAGRTSVLALVWAALLLPLSVVSRLWIAGVVTVVAGLPLAPLNTRLSLLIRDRLPADRQAEAFSIAWSAQTVGTGLGSALGAAMVSAFGARSLFVGLPVLAMVLSIIGGLGGRPSDRRVGEQTVGRFTGPAPG